MVSQNKCGDGGITDTVLHVSSLNYCDLLIQLHKVGRILEKRKDMIPSLLKSMYVNRRIGVISPTKDSEQMVQRSGDTRQKRHETRNHDPIIFTAIFDCCSCFALRFD